jgi:hypothetical protein
LFHLGARIASHWGLPKERPAMSEFHLTIALPPERQIAVGNILTSRYLGGGGRLLVLLVPLGFCLAFGLGITWFNGSHLMDGHLIATYGFIGAVIGLVLMQRLSARRYARVLGTSANRTKPAMVSLAQAGIRFRASDLPWDAVSQTGQWQDCTLIQFSALDALVIPDADLPDDLSPAAFAAHIADWKAK